jgi:hypothetical protein
MQFHKGNLTDKSMERRSRSLPIVAELEQDYSKVLREYEGLGEEESEEAVHHAHYEKWSVDVPEAVRILLGESLLKAMGTRCHAGFKMFRYDMFHVNDIEIYKSKINEICKFADDANRFREECFVPIIDTVDDEQSNDEWEECDTDQE